MKLLYPYNYFNTMNSNQETFESLADDAVLVISSCLTRVNENEDEVKNEFYSATMLIIDSFYSLFKHDNAMHTKWLAEVLLCTNEITFEQYQENAMNNNKITREELLGLLRWFLEQSRDAESSEADKIRQRHADGQI